MIRTILLLFSLCRARLSILVCLARSLNSAINRLTRAIVLPFPTLAVAAHVFLMTGMASADAPVYNSCMVFSEAEFVLSSIKIVAFVSDLSALSSLYLTVTKFTFHCTRFDITGEGSLRSYSVRMFAYVNLVCTSVSLGVYAWSARGWRCSLYILALRADFLRSILMRSLPSNLAFLLTFLLTPCSVVRSLGTLLLCSARFNPRD